MSPICLTCFQRGFFPRIRERFKANYRKNTPKIDSFTDMSQIFSMASPPKKVCIRPSIPGRKNQSIHEHFEHSGTPGRLRCKICYKQWVSEQIALRINVNEEESSAREIVQALIPSPQVVSIVYGVPLFIVFHRMSPLLPRRTSKTWRNT